MRVFYGAKECVLVTCLSAYGGRGRRGRIIPGEEYTNKITEVSFVQVSLTNNQSTGNMYNVLAHATSLCWF